MKRNVNVFLAVVLVAMLSGGLIWLRTAKDEKLGWNIHDTYGEAHAYANNGAAYTNATFAGPSNDGGVMTLSPSRTMRHSAVSSYAGAYAISYGVGSAPLTSNLSPLTSSPISSPSLQGGDGGRLGGGLYTTSSKTFNSYGGGNGGAMSYSQSPISNSQSPISNSQSPIANLQSPIAYSTARRGEMTAMGENLAMMTAENPVMAMTNATQMSSPYEDVMVAGFYNAYINGTYGNMGGQSNVRGRQNSSTLEDAWNNWLADWLAENGYTSADLNGDGIIDDDEVAFIYAALQGDSNTGMGILPTIDDIREFLTESLPVGDILPLLLIALLYIVAMYLRTKCRTQVND